MSLPALLTLDSILIVALVALVVLRGRRSARHVCRQPSARRVAPGLRSVSITAIESSRLLGADASRRRLVWVCPQAYPGGITHEDLVRLAAAACSGSVVELLPHVLAVDPLGPLPTRGSSLNEITMRVSHWRTALIQCAEDHARTHQLAGGVL